MITHAWVVWKSPGPAGTVRIFEAGSGVRTGAAQLSKCAVDC